MHIVTPKAAIFNRNDKLLIIKRDAKEIAFPNKWTIPGGKLQEGEDVKKGLKREVKEETQLEINLLAPLPPFDRIVRVNDEVSLHVIYIDYLARVTGGELKVGSDIGEAIWIEKERIPEIWEELHEDTRRLLQIAKVVNT